MSSSQKDVALSQRGLAQDAGDTGYVKAMGLKIGYSNDVVVADISFELGPGEAFALIGTNGSGKSTLLKTIVGLLPPLGGQLSVFGMPPGNNHRRIAYLGQFHHSGFVLPIRAIDVVRMGRFPCMGYRGRMSRGTMKSSYLPCAPWASRIWPTLPLRSMSGGQQQRTYLAQVLAHQADLLVLDEPTSGLDAGGRELYLHAINDELCRGASVIMATHDIQEEAALCHQVMLLARRVVAIGAPQDVMTPDALLETFGIVVAGEHKLHVLESKHGHDGNEQHGSG